MKEDLGFSREYTTYFDVAGPHNTDKTLDLAADWAQAQDLTAIVVASTSGSTACRLAERLPESFHSRIIIARQKWGDSIPQIPEGLGKLEEVSKTYWIPPRYLANATHPLVPATLRELSHGIKVSFECAYFLVANSFLSPLRNLLCVAGTRQGADSAVELFVNRDSTLKLQSLLCLPKK